MPSDLPLHSQLYAAMSERIRAGVWRPGDRVPSEKELIAEFGTSRGPVRQAMAALRAEGFIVGGRGSPPRVQPAVPSQSFDTFMSFTEWARELGSTPGQRVIESSRRLADDATARELGVEPESRVVDILRLRLLDDVPVMLERSAFPPGIGRHLLEADLDEESIYQTLRALDIRPVRGRHTIDAVTADPGDARWLGIDEGHPLMRVRRLSFDEQGAVIETADDRYLPHLANFTVENTADRRTPLTRTAVASRPAA